MKRKLIKQGGGGCVIYVPKKWLDAHNLGAGDSLNIKEEDNGLMLSSESIKHKMKEIDYKVKGNIDFRSLLGGFYRLGYDKIKLKFNDFSNYSEVNKAINTLQGYEITKSSKTDCIIEMIYNEDIEDILKYYLRLKHIIKTSYSIIYDNLINKKTSELPEIYSLRLTFVKLRDLIMRSINKNSNIKNNYSVYIHLVSYLWLIIRNYYYFYKEYCDIKKIGKRDIELFTEVNEFFKEVYVSKTNFLKTRKRFEKLLEKLKSSNSNYSVYLSNIIFAIDSSRSTLNIIKNLGR